MSKTRSYEQLIEGMGPTITTEGPNVPVRGLTKREYFAAMAIQGTALWSRPSIAEKAVEIADALIEELERTKDEN